MEKEKSPEELVAQKNKYIKIMIYATIGGLCLMFFSGIFVPTKPDPCGCVANYHLAMFENNTTNQYWKCKSYYKSYDNAKEACDNQ